MPGRRTDIDDPVALTPRRIRILRARYLSPIRMGPCACGCGLVFPLTGGRRFHPQCPTQQPRDKRGRLKRNRSLLASAPKPRRCELCEDMPHRRLAPRCPVCWGGYAEDVIERVPSGPGCALGGE